MDLIDPSLTIILMHRPPPPFKAISFIARAATLSPSPKCCCCSLQAEIRMRFVPINIMWLVQIRIFKSINIRIINPAGSTLIVALMQTLFDAILVAEAMIAFRVDLRIGEMAAQADGTYELLVNERFL
jgi:hypothetical protein